MAASPYGPLLIHVMGRRAKLRTGPQKLGASGRRGDVTEPLRRGNNPATRLKGGRKPSLFFYGTAMHLAAG